MDITVRLAVADDLADVRFVGFATWPPTYGHIAGADYVVAGLDEYWSADAIAAAIDAGDLSVATIGDGVVGVSHVDRFGADLVMWKLYVLPEYQRAGIGRALLDAVKDRAAAEGRALVTEHVAANARAGDLYRAQGFVVTAEAASALDSVWLRFTP